LLTTLIAKNGRESERISIPKMFHRESSGNKEVLQKAVGEQELPMEENK
jgi:hypothetical protein